MGDRLDIDEDGRPDVRFSRRCGFLLQLEKGRIVAVETDAAVSAEIQGKKLSLRRHFPQTM